MKKLFAVIMFIVSLWNFIPTEAEILLPEEGETVKKNGGLIVDCSNMEQGYVLIKTNITNNKTKIQVKYNDITLMYDINNNKEYETFPLQYGSGKYSFSLYQNEKGKRYTAAGKISLNVKLSNELNAYLYPNQYVKYNADTSAVQKAEEICKGLDSQEEVWNTIKAYVKGNFSYDYVKASSIEKGILPDIDGAWLKHMGICQDLSAITVAMLRSQGVPARLMIGTLRGGDHAWVSVNIDGKERQWDPTASLQGVKYSAKEYELQRQY